MLRRTLPLVAALVASLWSGCTKDGAAAPGSVRLAYVTNGVDPFWTIAEAGALQAGKDLGVDVRVEMPPNGIADQKQILEDLITRGVQGIAVSPIDHVNQTALLDKLAAQVPLITHDSDAPASKRICFVGMDNYEAGRMVGQLVKAALPSGGEVMIFVGRLEQDNARLRTNGVIDELLGRARDDARKEAPDALREGGGFRVLGVQTDQFDKSVAKANAADALTAHPEIDCMVGLFAYNPPAILEALRQAGKLGQVQVVGFDESDPTLQGIGDGHVFGTVVQDPYNYGYRSIVVLKALAAGDRSGIPANGEIMIPARKITKGEVATFWADKKAKLSANAGHGK